jgi:signal transduction histidine kinase
LVPITTKFSPSLSGKLVLGFLLVALPAVGIMAGIGFYAFRDLTQVNSNLRRISQSLEAVRDLQGAVLRTAAPLSEFLVGGPPPKERQLEQLFSDIEVRVKRCADEACHGSARHPGEMARGLFPNVQGIKDRASILFSQQAPESLRDKSRLVREINQQGAEVARQLERMSSALMHRVETLQGQSREVDRRARGFMVAAMLGVVGLAVLAAYLISRQLLRPIQELLLGTRRIMEGDVGYRVDVGMRDETGELARSFNAMAEEIQGHRERLEKIIQAKTTELKQAQDSLLRSEKLASIGLLASGVAHELNNPLTTILLNTKLLMEEAGPQSTTYAELKRISDDTLRCKRIIDDLRDFSRPHELQIQPTSLNKLVTDTLGFLAHQLKLQELKVAHDLDPRIPLIPCDPDRIKQVLMNVLINAIQATPHEGSLLIRTELRDRFAAIAVEDTGPGISAEIRGRIFDPFFTTKPEGSGLGLSIAYGIVEEHGGKIEVESRTGDPGQTAPSQSHGTTIRLLLPLTPGKTVDKRKLN